MRGARLLVFALLFVSVAARGYDAPSAPIAITKIESPDGLTVWAENRQGVELTVTLEGSELLNVLATPALPRTVTVPGGQRMQLVRFRQADPQQRWNCRYKWFWTWGPLQARHDDACVYHLPYASGTRYRISQGYNGAFSHSGDSRYALDFDMPLGSPVLACREGTVVAVEERYDQGGPTEYFRNRVNKVVVKHSDGTIGEYDHFKSQGVEVEVGDGLRAGTLVGYSGATGYVSGPHMHFMVYKAIDGRKRQSFPTRFEVKDSPTPSLLEEGHFYTAP